jgi:hypothetical protein
MYGNKSPVEYADSLIHLWTRRKRHTYYTQWPETVKHATREIDALKQSLQPYESTVPDANDSVEKQRQPVIEAFQAPPTLTHPGDNEETVLQVLQHYYRRPGAERVYEAMRNDEQPAVWKNIHSCSHALRARNNVHWYMALLEQFGLAHFSADEKALLALAIVYHDAAAEDVGKQDEERQSARYFMRDLDGHFPKELLNKVGKALENKEDDLHGKDEEGLDDDLRTYLRVLRFGDRMDFIRCSTVTADFPAWNQQAAIGAFDPDRLDLPPEVKADFSPVPEQKTPFQRALEACMHGAVDLAAVTGGRDQDLRQQGSYVSQYGLTPDGNKLKRAFERTSQPLAKLDGFLDDNVRRVIAAHAGINTCVDDDHASCQADTHRGVTRGIHNSWHDLAQIRIPAGMTRTEKMQCRHDLSVLDTTTRQAIHAEVTRLKTEGIRMNLGTLTQTTLKSAAAVETLNQRGLDVVTEKRRRGYDSPNEPNWQQVLVPKKKEEHTDTNDSRYQRVPGQAKAADNLESCKTTGVTTQ